MNKNIIKLFAILVMCFIFGGVLVACGSKNEQVGPYECSDDCDCRGVQGIQGVAGQDGVDGMTPYIGPDGNWWIGPENDPNSNTHVPAIAKDLTDCENHHWESEPLTAHSYNAETGVATVGVNILICKDCGDAKFERIDHTFEAAVTAPTCTSTGYTTYSCACGYSYVADKTEKLPHNYNAVVTAPTCTSTGYTTYTCACGDTYVANETEKLPHSYNSVVTAPDCYNDGYTTHTCSVCGDTYVDAQTNKLVHTPAVPFNKDNPDLSVWHEADRKDNVHPCLTEKVYATNCIYCDIELFETGYAPDHTWGTWSKAHNNTNVCDCEWNVYIRECSVCFEKEASNDPALIGDAYKVGHVYEGWKVSVEPTADAKGELVNNCVNCSCCPEIKVLDALTSDSDAYTTEVTPAKCEVNGKTVYTYSIDGKSFSFEVVIPATGHTYGSNSVVEVVKVPTVNECGSATITCEACGAVKTEVLPKLEEGEYIVKADPENCQALYSHIVVINGVTIEVSFNIVGKYIHVDYTTDQPLYEVEGENYIYTVYRCTRCNDWVVIDAKPYN